MLSRISAYIYFAFIDCVINSTQINDLYIV